MRDYSIARSSFWTGETGRRIRGQADVQRVAFYLFTAPSSNMIGLYYLPLPTICHELGITSKGASKALQVLGEIGYARYDFHTEWVWVCEMARHQLGASVSSRDKRHKGVIKQLRDSCKSPFAKDFWDRYHESFELPEIEFGRGLEGASKGLLSPTDPVPVPDPLRAQLEEFFTAWNQTTGARPMAKLTDKRRAAIGARLAETEWDWRAALAKFPLPCFASDPNGWQPDIDFFLRPDSVTRILEGKYDWKKTNGKPTPAIGAGQRHDPNAKVAW